MYQPVNRNMYLVQKAGPGKWYKKGKSKNGTKKQIGRKVKTVSHPIRVAYR